MAPTFSQGHFSDFTFPPPPPPTPPPPPPPRFASLPLPSSGLSAHPSPPPFACALSFVAKKLSPEISRSLYFHRCYYPPLEIFRGGAFFPQVRSVSPMDFLFFVVLFYFCFFCRAPSSFPAAYSFPLTLLKIRFSPPGPLCFFFFFLGVGFFCLAGFFVFFFVRGVEFFCFGRFVFLVFFFFFGGVLGVVFGFCFFFFWVGFESCVGGCGFFFFFCFFFFFLWVRFVRARL